MSMRHLPSLQTLRAFEAAGRHQSYSRAAEELGLTHGAVSHRIRELEMRVGERLFERNGRRMVPTSDANRLLVNVRHALGVLDRTFVSEPAKRSRQRLRISVLPSLAVRWLVSRLGAFRSAHPEIDLHLHTSVDLVDFDGGGFDAAIRYGPGDWLGVQSEWLADELLFPVCSPGYRDRLKLRTPADLGLASLLRHSWQPWASWLQAAGLDLPEPDGPTYADSMLLLQAAAAGEGVALARGLLACDDLRAGVLVRPFDIEVADTYGYYLIHKAPAGQKDHAVSAFSAWISPLLKAP